MRAFTEPRDFGTFAIYKFRNMFIPIAIDVEYFEDEYFTLYIFGLRVARWQVPS